MRTRFIRNFYECSYKFLNLLNEDSEFNKLIHVWGVCATRINITINTISNGHLFLCLHQKLNNGIIHLNFFFRCLFYITFTL